ncbi:MAG: hypothetical protein HOC20_08860 [Chloroflexi bacterium]|nr:hypothetical protein [Chloroflexota bacterium]
MKKGVLLGLIVGMMLIAAAVAIPALAHGPNNGETPPSPNQGHWGAMTNACLTGDWEAMADTAQNWHEQGSGYGLCQGPALPVTSGEETNTSDSTADGNVEYPTDWWDEMSEYMGGGMMNNQGGHMGSNMMGW